MMMGPYALVDDLPGHILAVAMPRTGRLYAPGETAHVVARFNDREFYPSPDPRLDAREPRWTRQRAVGGATFLTHHLPPTGETKNCSRAPTNSTPWRLRGVR